MYRSEKAENLKFREFSKTSFTRLFLCCLLLLSLHVVQCLSAADEENEGTATSFAIDCLAAHNEYRDKHGVPPLKLNDKITKFSQSWADHLASTGKFEHSFDENYGENIYTVSNPNPDFVVSARDIIKCWYEEISLFTFGEEPMSLDAGHFTQLIWKDTEELGIAYAKTNDARFIIVANYFPPGNEMGKFIDNVPPVDSNKAGAINILTPGETYFGASSPTLLKIICVIFNTIFIFIVNALQRI